MKKFEDTFVCKAEKAGNELHKFLHLCEKSLRLYTMLDWIVKGGTMRRLYLKVRAKRAFWRTMGRVAGMWLWVTKLPQPLRRWWIKRRINRSICVLDALDWNMQRAGWTRRERRRFWSDFIKKHEVRMEVFNLVGKQ